MMEDKRKYMCVRIKPHKPRTRSVMLFEDEDVLFGATDENPSVDLFSSQSPVSRTEQHKSLPAELAPETKVKPPLVSSVSIGGATTGTSSTDLFGNEDEEDDLFSITRNAVPRKALASRGSKVTLSGATTSESSSDLFSDKTSSSLFEHKGKTAQEEEAPEKKEEDEDGEEEAPKPTKKKMAGAVSMFGGMDPRALLQKRSQITGQPEPEPEPDDLPSSSTKGNPLGGGDEDDGDLFSKPPPEKPSAPKPASKPPKPSGLTKPTVTQKHVKSEPEVKEKPVSRGASVGKLKANLAINPAALLPGATPPTTEPENVAVSFDQPVQTKILHSMAKDRAKIQIKRRPSSRHARRAAADQSEGDVPASSVSVSPPSTIPEHAPAPSLGTTQHNAVKHTTDFFGNDDMLGDSTSPPLDSADIFVSVSSSSSSVPKKQTSDTSKKDSLFGSPISEQDSSGDIFSSVPKSNPAKMDDIFGTESVEETVPDTKPKGDSTHDEPMLTEDGAATDAAGAAGDNNEIPAPESTDDIFASSDVTTIKPKSKPFVIDDDIFADSSLAPKKVQDEDIFSAPASKTSKSVPKDDEDDIFAAKPKRTHKKATTKDEDLFRDDTDIFADLPPSKPKVKKSKKKKEEKSIFKDDVDDIFASAASKPKTKKSTTKKKETGGAKKGDSIFDDDAPSIFDDPLSSMTK